jgi:hypothetical protein
MSVMQVGQQHHSHPSDMHPHQPSHKICMNNMCNSRPLKGASATRKKQQQYINDMMAFKENQTQFYE